MRFSDRRHPGFGLCPFDESIDPTANEDKFSDRQHIESSLFRWNLLDSIGHEYITLQQLHKLTRNQRVNVKATLTVGSLEPKERIKRNGSKGRVKEDCVLEDKTGNAIIHLWDDTATTLTSG